MLNTHILMGAMGFLLGLLALILPKFGVKAIYHRRVGQMYAIAMLIMGVLSIPLAIQGQNTVLLVIGIVTLGWIVAGWRAILVWRSVCRSDALSARKLLRRHIILMSASYVGAWTAFLLNVRPLGSGSAQFWFYVFAPTVIGGTLITRRVRQLPRVTQLQQSSLFSKL